MRTVKTLSIVPLVVAALVAGCSERAPSNTVADNPSGSTPSLHGGAAPAAPTPTEVTGKVVETMDSGGYTYALLEAAGEETWVAGPPKALEVGDDVVATISMEMRDFTSNTLNRTFPRILFAESLALAGEAVPTAAPNPHGTPPPTTPPTDDLEGIARPEGGATVEEIFLMKDELVGVEVTFRGKVVKYSGNIMDRNWLHVQDGTGGPGTNDLTVTTDVACRVGDIVLVRGVLVADRDFGHGYFYDLIVEDARVTVE